MEKRNSNIGVQLDLFEGILFTVEQEQKIAEFIKNREDIAKVNENLNKQNEQLLIDNNFVKGVDFVNTFKVKIVTREMTLGYSYNNTDFKAEITYKEITGSISLKGKRFDTYSPPNELVDYMFSVDFQNGNVNSYGIQNNSRFIKPKTLIEKLKAHDSRQEYLYQEYLKKNDLKQSVIDKYTKLYPNAEVSVGDDWTKYSGRFEVITVKFKSGSYIQFRLDTYKNVEYIYKKYDAEFDKLTTEELLERFSKQEALK